MSCHFCGRYTRRKVCVCGHSEDEVIGIGAEIAGVAAARLCQTLASAGTVFDDLRAAVVETTRVLDAEGVGRLAATKLALDGDVEDAIAEAWGYRREEVTLWGEPLGRFELPASVLGRTTRRVDRREGAIAFTIVEDERTGQGFVGVWDPEGRLLWAPPQACDLRFDADDVELLFTSWRERRAWPSGKRIRRAAASREGKNLRITLARGSRRVAILTDADGDIRLWVPGGKPDIDVSIVRDGHAPVDAVFARNGRFVAVVTGAESAPEAGLTEYPAATVSYYSLTKNNGTQTAIFAPVPDPLPANLAVLPAPEIVDSKTIRIRLPDGTVRAHRVEERHLKPQKTSGVAWKEVERPRVRLPRRAILGDFGRPLLDAEIELPTAVDFEPIPVTACARAGGAIAFTLRPRFGREPTGMGVHHFPAGGAGVTAIWDEASGKLLHVLDEPGAVQWLADDVVLVFHVDSLEALRWPTRERLWRIPLASPLRGEHGPGIPAELAIGKGVAVVMWTRASTGRSEYRFAYTLVDLGARPAQRLDSAYVSRTLEHARGPSFTPDGRLALFGVANWGWFRTNDGYRGPGVDVTFGRLHVHDVVANTVAEAPIRVRTPAKFAPPPWRGSDVVGAPRVGTANEVLVELPFGETWRFELAQLGAFAPVTRPESTPLPRITVTCGEADRRATFPVPLEVPFTLAGRELWARRVSWSESLDRVALTLAPADERQATTLCGVWDPRSGDLVELLPATAVAFGAWETTIAILSQGVLHGFAWSDRTQTWTLAAGAATDFSLGRWQGSVNVAFVEEGGFELRVTDRSGQRGIVHQTRRLSTFRGPCWSSEGRHVILAAFDATTSAAGELIVVDTHYFSLRETALPRDLAATTLDVTVDDTVRLGQASWRLADLVPDVKLSSYLPTPFVIPTTSGFDALDELGRIPSRRLAAQGARFLPEQLVEYDEYGLARLGALRTEIFDRSPLPESAVLVIPFLVAMVADPEITNRESLVALLARIHARADDEGDTHALEAFRASRDWLVAGAATSEGLGALLAR